MCDPIDTCVDPIQGAMLELISAQSSLNMAPEPMEHKPEEFYLSQVDYWAAHSMEHMQAVFKYLRAAEKKIRRLEDQVRRYQIELAEGRRKQ